MMTESALILAQMTLGVSAAIAVVALMRPLLRRLFGARAAYAAWATVPVVAIAPLLPQPSTALRIEVGALRLLTDSTIATEGAGTAGPDAIALLLAVYAAGVVVAIGSVVIGQKRFLRGLGPLRRRGAGLWRAASGASGPCLVGIWRPRIVVPADFASRYAPGERRLIVAHEREHRRQGDPFHNAVLVGLTCLQWFNPLVHLAAGRFRRDQELACDARVVRRFPGARRRYAEAMLKTQHPDLALPLGCTWQSRHPLEERIAMLHHALPGRLRRAAGTCAVAALIGAAAGSAWALQTPADGPTYANLTAPTYPTAADGSYPEGTVYLKVRVGADGKPRQVELARVVPTGLPASAERALVDSAIAAVQTWTFNPALRDARAVEGETVVPIRFSATEDAAAQTPADAGPALDTITVSRP